MSHQQLRAYGDGPQLKAMNISANSMGSAKYLYFHTDKLRLQENVMYNICQVCYGFYQYVFLIRVMLFLG